MSDSTTATKIRAWHWVQSDRTLRDERPLVIGETVRHDGPLVICRSGLHASERIFDALRYAPGPVICRVECDGIGERHSDKFVCSERTALWAVDAEQILRAFARRCALDVAHLWDMPQIVREYFETRDASKRDAARAAAWAAAMAAARAAAWAVAWEAAGDAAGAVAVAAAWEAAWEAAGAVAEDAARAQKLTEYNNWLTEMVETAR
jgi:hypothetical protein